MRAQLLRKRMLIGLGALLIVAFTLVRYQPVPAAAPALPPTSVVYAAARPADTAVPQITSAPAPSVVPATPTTPALATPTTDRSTPTPSVVPTPTSRPSGTLPRVGVQVGHWKSSELPDELRRLRTSTGAFAGGYKEADVNLNVAERVVKLLESRGLAVDLLPATIPPGYDADAFVAIHADGSTSNNSRGFKLATPWRTSRAAQMLLDVLADEYGAASGMPRNDAITFNMRGYYAFNYRRHQYAVAKTTPSVIVEMGFLTSPADRAILVGGADNIAIGIANGIIRYLNERDPNDGAALIPPDYKVQRPLNPEGVDVRAAPRDGARLITRVDPNGRIFVFQERDGWYQGFVRGGSRVLGWFRKDQVIATDDPQPTPPPVTDS